MLFANVCEGFIRSCYGEFWELRFGGFLASLLCLVCRECYSCGKGELVNRVHTLVGRSAQVVCELQVLEEEKVREDVQEIEKENQGEEKRSDDHDHVNGVKDSTLEPRCVCR